MKKHNYRIMECTVALSISMVLVNCSSVPHYPDAQIEDPNAQLDKAISNYYNAVQKKQFGKVYGMISDEYWDWLSKQYPNAVDPDEKMSKREFVEEMRDNSPFGHKDNEMTQWKVLKRWNNDNKAYILMNTVWIDAARKEKTATCTLYDVWIYSSSKWSLRHCFDPYPPNDWPKD